jgi:hypothetical protein
MTRVAYLLLLPLLIVSSLAGCEVGDSPLQDALVRDSAGIRIVENVGQRWPQGRGWRLSDFPSVSIGSLEGCAEYQFELVVGALKLDDGRIVVADNGAGELRFYDADGTYLSTTGRKGGGPGEFEELARLWPVSGDSVMTWDYRLRRLSIFDTQGRFVRSWILGTPGNEFGWHWPFVSLGDGSLIVGFQDYSAGFAMDGVIRDTLTYYMVDQPGIYGDSLGRFLFDESYRRGDFSISLPFGRAGSAAGWGNGFYFGDGHSHEFRYYTADGALRRIIRMHQPNMEVTKEDVGRYKEERIAGEDSDAGRERVRELLEEVPFPETMPAYDRILVDVEGNIWVLAYSYAAPGDDQPRWTVFDPEGVALGVVEGPPRFRILQIGANFVLGRALDEMDVQYVRLYELVRK